MQIMYEHNLQNVQTISYRFYTLRKFYIIINLFDDKTFKSQE